IFFNAALVSCVHSLLQGKETSLGDGISHAVRHVGSILVWALVAATVGIILRFIGERGGIIGRIAVAIVGGIWSFVTIFVVPILVIEDKGVADAVKESVALFRKTWGESVVGSVSIGIIFGAVAALGVFVVLAAGLLGGLSGFLLALALLFLLITVLAVISSAMQGIFVVALYTYAKTGTVPQGFGKGVIEQAFVPKGPVFGAGNI
ncbi:MAG: DUF6159 family protein, partial [Methanomicrobiales archaeon]|nr:DUF6159 family protein [Methanomicrobiales archaeon]